MITSQETIIPPSIELDFQKAVEESKQNIQSQVQLPPKRGRGRPRKDPLSPQTNPQPTDSPLPLISPPPNIAAFIETPLIALSKLPAQKHMIPELALSPDEAKACAEALNQCLQAFIPDINRMSPKTAAVIGCLTTFGAIGFTKYALYSEVMNERRAKASPEPDITAQELVAKAQTDNPIPAQDYFRGR